MIIFQDVSSDVVVSRASTIATILISTEEISLEALHNCSTALISMVTAHGDLAASDGAIDRVLQAMSTIISQGKFLPVSISRQISQCMDKLIEAKGKELVPGETTNKVIGNIRFLTSVGFLAHAEATTYSAPQTSLEEFLRASTTSMMFSHGAITYSTIMSPNMRHVSRALNGRTVSASGSDDGGNGAAVQVSVSQSNINYLPGRSPNTTATKVTLSYDSDPGGSTVVITIPNNSPIPYYEIRPQNGSVACKRIGRPYSVTANCSAAPDLNVTCPGNDTRILKFICPGKKLVPVCLAWNGEDYVASDACTVIAYNPYNTTCACEGTTGYNEALGEPATTNPQIDNIAASADLVVSGFVNTWTSAEDLSPDSLTRNKVRRLNFLHIAKAPNICFSSIDIHTLFPLR